MIRRLLARRRKKEVGKIVDTILEIDGEGARYNFLDALNYGEMVDAIERLLPLLRRHRIHDELEWWLDEEVAHAKATEDVAMLFGEEGVQGIHEPEEYRRILELYEELRKAKKKRDKKKMEKAYAGLFAEMILSKSEYGGLGRLLYEHGITPEEAFREIYGTEKPPEYYAWLFYEYAKTRGMRPRKILLLLDPVAKALSKRLLGREDREWIGRFLGFVEERVVQ